VRESGVEGEEGAHRPSPEVLQDQLRPAGSSLLNTRLNGPPTASWSELEGTSVLKTFSEFLSLLG